MTGLRLGLAAWLLEYPCAFIGFWLVDLSKPGAVVIGGL